MKIIQSKWAEEPLFFSEGMAEVAEVAVRTRVAGENHAADLGFVPWIPDHRTQLRDAVCELAIITVRTLARLLPLVAQLHLEHPLVVRLKF